MDWKNFKRQLDRAVLQTWTLRIAVIAMSVVIIVQMFMIARLALNSKTIILPPRVGKAFYVTGSKISKGYMVNMGQYLSQTLLDLTPQNYKAQLNMFLQFAYPADYNALKIELSGQMKALATLSVSQAFFPKTVSVKNHFIYVGGILLRVIGDKSKSYQKTLKIGYLIKNGELYVKSVSYKKQSI
ncbi:MAG: TraE/TraK family type IV conjugative transfer system protein [bacterium]